MKQLRTRVVDAGTRLHRGAKVAHPDCTQLVPGAGDTRFAPIDGAAHAYVATTAFAALLESALHDATPPDPRIYRAQIDAWLEGCVTLTADLRFIDLSDPALARLGIERAQLVATHYPCTRAWAEALHGRAVGGHPTHGLVWDSRQADVQAAGLGHRPALAELVAELPATVGVIWSPPAPAAPLANTHGGLGPLNGPAAEDYVNDLVALLGIVVE